MSSGWSSSNYPGSSGGQAFSNTGTNSSEQTGNEVQDDAQSLALISKLEKLDEQTSYQEKLQCLNKNVAKLASTQSGSRYLQKEMTKAKDGLINFLVNDIGNDFPTIMIDNYGNYFC